MQRSHKKIPKKYHPKGFEILYEDRDIIVGNKAAGFLTVRALWNKEGSIHSRLNEYVRKGNPKSHKRVFVVHRLDQDTTGVMIFAKTFKVQETLKAQWKGTKKIYYAVVHGHLKEKSGTIESYLEEDEDYVVHSSQDKAKGELAKTAYKVLKETEKYSLLEIDLLTGKKNQIRVHMADLGHPVVGDEKYGAGKPRSRHLALHSKSIAFAHPFSGKRMMFEAPVPEWFDKLMEHKDTKSQGHMVRNSRV